MTDNTSVASTAASEAAPRLRTAWERELRMWSGLVLLIFVTTHLANHAVGIFGVDAMEAVQVWRVWVWRSWVGTALLYGAAFIHISLALKRIVSRRTWRMPIQEALQIALGLTIPLLLYEHLIGTRILSSFAGLDSRYLATLRQLWPQLAWTQTLLVLVVWAHGMIGLHYMVRSREWYPRVRLVGIIVAVMLPLLALAGFVAAGREALEFDTTHGTWTVEQITLYGDTVRRVNLGLLVVATIALGIAHSTGLWYGVGYWSALWTHSLLALLVVILVGWHVLSRPSRRRATDLDRRALLGGLSATALAAISYTALEGAVRAAGLDGAGRRFTGSHERGSFDPDAMPTVQWIDDTAPEDVDAGTWPLVIDGRPTPVSSITAMARTVDADLDCTGGWWSRQAWDVVPLSALLPGLSTRSIEVTSSTGYARVFPASEANTTYVAVGYGGRALRRGHGAPVRIVAPGRRGPWWVKWVVSIEPSDRPWWAQSPFPLT